jgi:membrane-associated progesterone receptor component
VISVSRNNRKGEEEEGGGGSYRCRGRERSIMAVLQDALDFIPRYTGLTPVTFFTVVALVMGIYYLITSMLAPPPPPVKRPVVLPLPPPVQLGEVTLEELAAYNGSDPQKPLLMAIKAQIYDVSQSRFFSSICTAFSPCLLPEAPALCFVSAWLFSVSSSPQL